MIKSNCPQSLINIQILENRFSVETISDEDLILRIKNYFTDEANVVCEHKLTHEHVRALNKEIGIGAQGIFSKFNRQSTNPNSIRDFAPFLLEIFNDCPQSVNIIQEKIRRINSRS